MKREGGREASYSTVRIWFQTVAIEVCLIFNVAVVSSLKYFRFLFVKLSL